MAKKAGCAFVDNSAMFISAKDRAVQVALAQYGLDAETEVKRRTPVGTPRSTAVKGYHGGTLRNSISHEVRDDAVYVGTNIPYSKYVELGTGIYATNGNGRRTPWVWIDQNGKGHFTSGMKPKHMIKNGVEATIKKFKAITEKNLKNAD